MEADEKTARIEIGVVIRRIPATSRWATWTWRAVAVLPGAAPADWAELRREGETVEYHAATRTLELHRAETEAYRVALSNDPPTVWAVLREDGDPSSPHEIEVFSVTASPFDAQDHLDSGEEIVEAIPMPPALIGWISDFVARHHREEPFIKRRRDRVDTDRREDGRGDPRVGAEADVYLSPAGRRRRLN